MAAWPISPQPADDPASNQETVSWDGEPWESDEADHAGARGEEGGSRLFRIQAEGTHDDRDGRAGEAGDFGGRTGWSRDRQVSASSGVAVQ
jgi:hypothetical protein